MHRCLNLVLEKEKDFDFFLVEQKKVLCESLKRQFTKECNFRELIKFVHESIILGKQLFFIIESSTLVHTVHCLFALYL